jgi:tryptophan-rich sensory protein
VGKVDFQKLTISLLGPLVAGAVGSFFTITQIPTWYASLQKPSFNPPNSVFGPVWTLLYFFMGFALYDVWVKRLPKNPNWRGGLSFFVLQLIANVFWSYVFFGLHAIGVAVLVILVLWFLILLTIVAFWRISRVASILLVPYILWVSFATLLNAAIFLLNR